MAFYIVEPSLRDHGGHHFEFATTIAAAARSIAKEITIFAHKDCSLKNAGSAKVIPWFSHHIYEDRKSTIGYRVSNFLYFNSSFFKDLRRLEKTFQFHPSDTILFPTVSENQLFGLFRWTENFKKLDAPSLIVYLMFSPDFWLPNSQQHTSERVTTERALFYKLAFTYAATNKTNVRMFAGGRLIAREFSALAQTHIDAHPLPLSLLPPKMTAGDLARPSTLLYAGVAKPDKGFLLLPDLVDRVSAANPTHQFLVHVDFGGLANTQTDMRATFETLKRLSATRNNFSFQAGILDREEYLAFINRADCFVCTYDPVTYARKTSGVLWEAIGLGMPILGPANTAMQQEASDWGAGFVEYTKWSAPAIAEAYNSFYGDIRNLTKSSLTASEQFYAANNNVALVAHLSDAADESRALLPLRLMPSIIKRFFYGRSILAWLHFRICQKLQNRRQPSTLDH